MSQRGYRYFDHREKPVAFSTFDRPMVGSWRWKVAAILFAYLFPLTPSRRNKQKIHFTRKGTIAKGKCNFPTIFFFRDVSFGGVSKLFNCSIFWDTWTEVTLYIWNSSPVRGEIWKKCHLKSTLLSFVVGSFWRCSQNWKATQPWNQAPKKNPTVGRWVLLGANWAHFFEKKLLVSGIFLSTFVTFRCFLLHEWFMETFRMNNQSWRASRWKEKSSPEYAGWHHHNFHIEQKNDFYNQK